ncbi:MAG: FtsX-like permease family protein [Gemmataceae bacterium]
MLSLYRTLTGRYLRQRWSRALLVAASIALGVATMVATQALHQSMALATEEAVSPLAGLAELSVGNGDAGVSPELAGRLRDIPGIRAVEPVLIGRVPRADRAGESVLIWGVALREHISRYGQQQPPAAALADNPWNVRLTLTNPLALLLPHKPPALVGQDLAAELPGSIRVLSAGQPRELTQLGTVAADGPAAQLIQRMLVMDLEDAARLLGQSADIVTRLDLFLEPGADCEATRRAVASRVAGQARVQTPEEQGLAMQEVLAGLQIGFSLCGAGALVVGLFLVYNALSVSVTERRHDIGILRSLGATRAQIASLFAGEAVLLGLVGAMIGLPIGAGLAYVALGPIQQTLSDVLVVLHGSEMRLTAYDFALAAGAGLSVALLASLVPALRAAADEPADAVRRAPGSHNWTYRLAQIGASGLLISVGLAGIWLRGQLPPRWGAYGGMVLALVGFLLLTPQLAVVLTSLLQPIGRRWFTIEGRLALDNLVRSRARTGLVIAAWAATVAMFVQTAGVTLSNEAPLMRWIEQTVTADLYVTCGGPLGSGGQNVAVPEEVGQRLADIPGVAEVLPIRFRKPDFRDTLVFLTAFPMEQYCAINRRRALDVPDLHLYERLTEPGTVLISHNFAVLHQVEVGDTIELAGPRGPAPLRVVGAIEDYSWNRGAVIVDWTTYQAVFDDALVDVFDLYAEPGHDAEAMRADVQAWCAGQGMYVTTRQQVHDSIRQLLRRIFSIAYVQEIVIGLVAALGVVTALLISVLQRQRELGLLRAVGASQGQLIGSVLAEAALMGLLGTTIGLIAGIPLEWYVVRVIILEESGFLFPMRLPWLEVLVIVALSLVAATLAGLGPALHTARLRITEAIAYE